ncbi:MAG: hypothetical protein AAF430_02180 [Myxococcota bacterium]
MNDPRNPIRFDPAFFDGLEENEEEGELTREELAWELVEVLNELSLEELNELVDKNVPVDTLEFFGRYATDFAEGLPIDAATEKRLPNLLLLGYLLRVLEDRLIVDPEDYDA